MGISYPQLADHRRPIAQNNVAAIRVAFLNLKLHHRFPRQFHLCTQSQRTIRLHPDDTPEVQRFSETNVLRIAPTTTQPRPTNQTIHRSPSAGSLDGLPAALEPASAELAFAILLRAGVH